MPRRKDFQLSRELIAEAALAIFLAEGLPALTTRRVAADLGASPMSLYVHVGNKQGLLDAVVERLMASIKIDLDSEGPWTTQAEQWVHSLRKQLSANPSAMQLLANRRWAVVRCTEPLMRALLDAGFAEEAAVRATRLLTWSTIGFLMVEAGVEPLDADEQPNETQHVERSLARLGQLEGGHASISAAKSQGVDRADIDALFSLQSRMLIDGLARLAGDPTGT